MDFIRGFGILNNECVLNVHMKSHIITEKTPKFDRWVQLNAYWEKPKVIVDEDVYFKDGHMNIYRAGNYMFVLNLPIQIKNEDENTFSGIIKARMVINKNNPTGDETNTLPFGTTIQSVVIPNSKIPGEAVLSLTSFIQISDADIDSRTNKISLQYLCNSYDDIKNVPENLDIRINTKIGQGAFTCIRI